MLRSSPAQSLGLPGWLSTPHGGIGEKVASNGEDLKGARQQVVQEAGGPAPVDCSARAGWGRGVSGNPHEDESSKQSARQCQRQQPFREEAMKTVARATEQLHAKPER
jgi:hypothetical protein